jgi:hypothetical protein
MGGRSAGLPLGGAWVAVGLVASALATGCGASGGSAESAEESAIREVTSRAFTDNDPAHCEQLATGSFLAQMYDGTESPLDDCKEDARKDPPDAKAAEVTSVEVQGARAQATAALSGGVADGTVMTFELLETRSGWKLNRLTEIEIDRRRYDDANRSDLIREGLTPGEANCAITRVQREFATAALENLYIEGEVDQLGGAVIGCVSRETMRELFVKDGFGADEPVARKRCIVDQFMDRYRPKALERAFGAGTYEQQMSEMGQHAAAACIDLASFRRLALREGLEEAGEDGPSRKVLQCIVRRGTAGLTEADVDHLFLDETAMAEFEADLRPAAEYCSQKYRRAPA